jgi:hypothetical protein
VYSVTTKADGSFHVGEPFWHWTAMVLDGHPAYDLPEPEDTALDAADIAKR